MGTAYTPGLKVTKWTQLTKARRLPIKGEVVVKEGDAVKPRTVVARAYLPGELHIVRLRRVMGELEPVELKEAVLVKKGDTVTKGQLLAKKKVFFGLFTTKAESPIDGTVEFFAPQSGDIGIREKPKLLELNAYIKGRVTKVLPQEGVEITTNGALIQGIFGVGGERQGTIEVVVNAPDEVLDEKRLPADIAGKVLVGGSEVTASALKRCEKEGAAGVICGGIRNEELTEFLGYEIGIAITGQEEIDTTLIVTEGFGKMAMAKRTFELLKWLSGREASINGATQIRAGAVRPEVIVPLTEKDVPRDERTQRDELQEQQLEVGKIVRIIRVPYFGRLAEVVVLPPELREIETGSKVRMLEARILDTGEVVSVPRANVEIIS